MSSMCLADFASWYDLDTRTRKTNTSSITELPEAEMEENTEDDPVQNIEHDESFKHLKLSSGASLRKRKKKKIIRSVRYNKKKDPEDHYRELLMLYIPWRIEENIIGNCETYEERYHQEKDIVEAKKSEYEHLAEELDKAEETLRDTEMDSEMYDSVAPTIQATEIRDQEDDVPEDIGDENLFTDYDIGPDIGIQTTSSAGSGQTEELIRNRISDLEYRADIRSLNVKQKEIFYHILKTVKTSTDQFFIFLSGGAGVGKTKVTKTIHQALLRHYNTLPGHNPELTNILLTAPTGKAAYLIGGRTIHSAFKIPANQNLKYKPLKSDTLNSLRTQLSNLQTLIIDEISMCGCNMFMYIDMRLQEVKQVKKPFGGVNILCIGDLCQLHPVMDNWIFQYPNDDYSILSPNVWVDRMQMFELTQIMRQAGDKTFAEALNNIREGLQTANDIDLIKSRMISKSDTEYPVNATHILYYNKSVDEHNSLLYEMASSDKLSNLAVDIVIGDVSPEIKQKILDRAPVKAGDAMGLQKTYKTAVGLRNELTVNLDVADGLVNGAGGITKKISMSCTGKPCVIWILFDTEDIGRDLRNGSKQLYNKEINKDWTPIKRVERQFPVGKYKNVKVNRKQFPLQLSCAKTVHRCQGDTLQEAVIQLPNEKRAHVHYVALSRVTSLQNLHILPPFDSSKITVSPDVINEMKRLREERKLQLCFTPINMLPPDHLKICFHNSQSVHLHFDDIKSEPNFVSSDILMFVESRLCHNDGNIQIPGFKTHRNDFSNTRSPYGTVLFIKPHLEYTVEPWNIDNIELTLLKVSSPLVVNILCVYCPPKKTFTSISQALTQVHAALSSVRYSIVVGDFNTNEIQFQQLNNYMASIEHQQLIQEPTTNNGTMIDLLYTNIQRNSLLYGVLESYYSHHKPVWVAVDMNKLAN